MSSATSNSLGVTPWTRPAGDTVTKDLLVKLDSSGNIVNSDAIADPSVGVALNSAAAGESVAVQSYGVAKIVAGGTFDAGVELMAKASEGGQVDTAAGATARSIGVALQAGVDGRTVEVLLALPAVLGPANA